MFQFADIAFPTAVRKPFTYHISQGHASVPEVGMRVWVPFQTHYAIGLVVRLHNQKPEFETRPIREILDKTPILSPELLKLTEWVHRFYFCSWGEVIQASLPAGLNFISNKYVRIGHTESVSVKDKREQEMVSELIELGKYPLADAKQRWRGTPYNKVLNRLIKNGTVEVWEEPDLKVDIKKEKEWFWLKENSAEAVAGLLNGSKGRLPKWKEALSVLMDFGLPARQSVLKAETDITAPTLSRLYKDGWLDSREVEVLPAKPALEYHPEAISVLNPDQQKAFEAIDQSLQKREFANYLLFGVTGSGKTEVYIHALKKALQQNRSGIVLVPEISLTPQTVARFYKIFGEEVAVLHSRMTNRERLQEWKAIAEGRKHIVIGPRSAIFAPVRDLGIIIIDEEHDGSYKQEDPAPRYHARETAIMRATFNKAVVVMGSATPSMQSLNMAAKGKCVFLELNNRPANAVLPEVHILDLKQYKHAMQGELAVPMVNAINEALAKKEQVILLYNRRGYASFMQCTACGHIPQSPECSVSLTYHKYKNMLLCHYSGYARKADTECEKCGSSDLIIKGSGTQKIEEELTGFFPGARILRFDKDSTSRKGAHGRIISSFERGEFDILIGTQLVAKGLDFPNVTVVGVIDADTEQAFPSFQSTERLYQLLSQVSGRSGRGDKRGVVFIQTRQPENPAIQFAKRHDHRGFAREEMAFRKPLNYPPYSRLVQFILKGKKENEVRQTAFQLADAIAKVHPGLETLGPSPAAISWMNQKYIWEFTIKIETDKGGAFIERMMATILDTLGKYPSSVRININVDVIR